VIGSNDVGFTAHAGVFNGALLFDGCSCSIIVSFSCVWFWHCVTMCTVSRTIFTHMRINHIKPDTLTSNRETVRTGGQS